MNPALEARSLHASYGRNVILRDMSLVLQPGEIVALMGRSGCGKSTLLRMLCGLQEGEDGEVLLHGEKVVERGKTLLPYWEITRQIMMVPQGPSLIPHLTVEDNIALGLRVVYGKSVEVSIEQAKNVVEFLGLQQILQSYPEELSGGQAQRVSLARAMVLHPKVLLLDEITSNIDPQTTREVIDALRKIKTAASYKQAIVVVTHLIDFARSFADQILFMADGHVHEMGQALSFAEKASKEETREFFSSLSNL